ncbi:hypothetical protein APR11_002238 [Nocardia amikacinitolerans]|uniref:hypothetical protein n=1 Tax=Nocardia amikacinitolerans TaxID=756689 RepID=UPI0020A245B0|nr:hypothetical protein [Nocardia amikacinitolerans]MCP2295820.1 hypothetical protein [Nocardia amikacinitolerans]
MNAWHIVSSTMAVLAGCLIAVTVLGCLWPVERPPRPAPAHRQARAHRTSAAIPWPRAWTCDLPRPPLTVEHAHRAMREHREHDCARKRAAFATLVAAGRITPDSARGRRPWELPS